MRGLMVGISAAIAVSIGASQPLDAQQRPQASPSDPSTTASTKVQTLPPAIIDDALTIGGDDVRARDLRRERRMAVTQG